LSSLSTSCWPQSPGLCMCLFNLPQPQEYSVSLYSWFFHFWSPRIAAAHLCFFDYIFVLPCHRCPTSRVQCGSAPLATLRLCETGFTRSRVQRSRLLTVQLRCFWVHRHSCLDLRVRDSFVEIYSSRWPCSIPTGSTLARCKHSLHKYSLVCREVNCLCLKLHPFTRGLVRTSAGSTPKKSYYLLETTYRLTPSCNGDSTPQFDT